MKKLFCLLLLVCGVSFGQKLIVTPDGLKSESDVEKSYIVLNVENKSAKELYANALKYIAKTYKNPEEVVKGNIENEYLKVVTHASDFITIKNSFVRTPFSVDYTYELSFKDGKVKYEIISLDIYDRGKIKLLFKGKGALSGYYIYNPKDELKKADAKELIENYFNSQILVVSESLQNKSQEDKW